MSKNRSLVAAYVRVSTQDQSTEIQKNDLTQFCESRGWKIFRLYEDKATGTNANRPMLKNLLSDARKRKFDLVLVWKLDRFFRSLKDMVTTLQELDDLGIEFVSLKDNIDLTTASGRLMMHMVSAFAEFEAALIRERVRAGIAAAKSKGKRIGKPRIHDYKKIRDLRLEGLSFSAIQKKLQISKGAVCRALSLG